MANKGKTLLFFTDTFPCGSGEAFIENEFPYLAAAFDKVIIITNNLTDPATRPVAPNTKVARAPYAASRFFKVMALMGLMEGFIQNEIRFIRKQLKLPLSRKILSVLFGSYAKALEMDSFLARLVKQEDIDEENLYLYSYWLNDMAMAAAYFKYRQPATKAFCRAHRWDIYMDKQPGAYLPFRNFIVQQLNACYVISNHGADYIKALTNHAYDTKINVARLGTLQTHKELSPGNTGKLVLVSCSSLIVRKRVHLIIEALALINDIPVEWTHIGDGIERQQTETLAAQKLNSKSNIKVLFEGQMTNAEILNYYATNAIDLFINVSESEGVPVSIMEANSFGIPAIATNTGGVNEMVETLNGFLLDVNSKPQQIADSITKYYTLPAETKVRMRMNAFNTWNTKYNAEKNYKAFVLDMFK